GAPRALCSFPTRRSSDLGVGVRRRDCRLWPPGAGGGGSRSIPVEVFLEAHCSKGNGPSALVLVCALAATSVTLAIDIGVLGRELDRKSTRLNSSHVKISY